MARDILAPRRMGELISFEYEGVAYTAQFGRNAAGTIAEVFLDGGKLGSAANKVAEECAVILSIALQYGAPLDVIFAGLPKLADGTSAGPVGMAIERQKEAECSS
jgi:hypothetical protein